MTDVYEGMVLLCPSPREPRCRTEFEVSPEDPDATLSEIDQHLSGDAQAGPAGTPEPRPHDLSCHEDPRAHWFDCECWCHCAPATSPTGDPR